MSTEVSSFQQTIAYDTQTAHNNFGFFFRKNNELDTQDKIIWNALSRSTFRRKKIKHTFLQSTRQCKTTSFTVESSASITNKPVHIDRRTVLGDKLCKARVIEDTHLWYTHLKKPLCYVVCCSLVDEHCCQS